MRLKDLRLFTFAYWAIAPGLMITACGRIDSTSEALPEGGLGTSQVAQQQAVATTDDGGGIADAGPADTFVAPDCGAPLGIEIVAQTFYDNYSVGAGPTFLSISARQSTTAGGTNQWCQFTQGSQIVGRILGCLNGYCIQGGYSGTAQNTTCKTLTCTDAGAVCSDPMCDFWRLDCSGSLSAGIGYRLAFGSWGSITGTLLAGGGGGGGKSGTLGTGMCGNCCANGTSLVSNDKHFEFGAAGSLSGSLEFWRIRLNGRASAAVCLRNTYHNGNDCNNNPTSSNEITWYAGARVTSVSGTGVYTDSQGRICVGGRWFGFCVNPPNIETGSAGATRSGVCPAGM